MNFLTAIFIIIIIDYKTKVPIVLLHDEQLHV